MRPRSSEWSGRPCLVHSPSPFGRHSLSFKSSGRDPRLNSPQNQRQTVASHHENRRYLLQQSLDPSVTTGQPTASAKSTSNNNKVLKNWWAFYLKFHKFRLSEASIFPRQIDSNPLHYSISLIRCPFAIRTKHQVSCSNDDWSEAAVPWLCTILKWFMHCTPWTHYKLYNSSGTSITQNVMVNSSPELSSLLTSAQKLCKIHSKLRCAPERKRSSKQHHQSTIPVVLCGGIILCTFYDCVWPVANRNPRMISEWVSDSTLSTRSLSKFSITMRTAFSPISRKNLKVQHLADLKSTPSQDYSVDN